MASGAFRFDRFALDPSDRQLRRDDAPVELNARYLDALILLVREQGKLVSKERFLEEVWRGVPVTDEALTQCIKTLRRQLGDDAGRPRFIETAPKHGYRFIAPVEWVDGQAPPSKTVAPWWRDAVLIGGAGTLGGGAAGLIGGLFYSFFIAPESMGAASAGLVLVVLTALIGLLGGVGVSFGIAAASYGPARLGQWDIVGGALGGLIVGGGVKMIGVDTFNLLLGQTPGAITGAPEGAVLGGAVGLAVWLTRGASLRRGMAIAAAIGAVTGVLIHALGGRLMAGSLALVSDRFPESRLDLDQIGALYGEPGFGPVTQAALGGFEAALFSAGVVGAMLYARARFTRA